MGQQTKLYEPLLDELSYDIERVIDKYRNDDNKRLPVQAVVGLFVSKAIEYSLEAQGIEFERAREAFSRVGV